MPWDPCSLAIYVPDDWEMPPIRPRHSPPPPPYHSSLKHRSVATPWEEIFLVRRRNSTNAPPVQLQALPNCVSTAQGTRIPATRNGNQQQNNSVNTVLQELVSIRQEIAFLRQGPAAPAGQTGSNQKMPNNNTANTQGSAAPATPATPVTPSRQGNNFNTPATNNNRNLQGTRPATGQTAARQGNNPNTSSANRNQNSQPNNPVNRQDLVSLSQQLTVLRGELSALREEVVSPGGRKSHSDSSPSEQKYSQATSSKKEKDKDISKSATAKQKNTSPSLPKKKGARPSSVPARPRTLSVRFSNPLFSIMSTPAVATRRSPPRSALRGGRASEEQVLSDSSSNEDDDDRIPRTLPTPPRTGWQFPDPAASNEGNHNRNTGSRNAPSGTSSPRGTRSGNARFGNVSDSNNLASRRGKIPNPLRLNSPPPRNRSPGNSPPLSSSSSSSSSSLDSDSNIDDAGHRFLSASGNMTNAIAASEDIFSQQRSRRHSSRRSSRNRISRAGSENLRDTFQNQEGQEQNGNRGVGADSTHRPAVEDVPDDGW